MLLIYLKVGDFPKTHYFDRLIEELSEIYEKGKIQKYYEDNILSFKALEDAYIIARYFPKNFSKKEVSSLINFSKDFLKFLKEITSEKFI